MTEVVCPWCGGGGIGADDHDCVRCAGQGWLAVAALRALGEPPRLSRVTRSAFLRDPVAVLRAAATTGPVAILDAHGRRYAVVSSAGPES